MIHITKTGFKRLEWDGGLRQDVEKEFESILCLREGVTQIEEGVTLGEIITFTYRDEFLRGFIGCYSSCNVGAFYEELQRGVKPLSAAADSPSCPVRGMRSMQSIYTGRTEDGELRYCTVAMEVIMEEVSDSKKYKIEKTLNVSLDFYGRGDDQRKWSLDLAPMAEIAALPFRLETNGCIEHLVDGVYQAEDGLNYTPSLLEVLDAIFFDISFHGSPAEKADRSLELERMAQEIKDGTATLAPLKLDEDQ